MRDDKAQLNPACARRARLRRRSVLLMPVIGAAALMLAGCGPYQKAKLDREVDRLCAIDGGVRIYETVTLPKENFGPDGEVFPQYRTLPGSSGRYGPDYFSTLESSTLIAGNPKLVKWHIRFFRRADGKLLAEKVAYERGGGDMPGPWNPTSHVCPTTPIKDQQIFIKDDSR